MKSKILVFLQYFLILLIILPYGTMTDFLIIGVVILLVGIFIGLKAINTQGSDNFLIRPDIKIGSKLIMHGVYKYIRHPMYLSVIMMTFGVVIGYYHILRVFIFALLVTVIIFKLKYEESLWIAHNNDYITYMKKTKKLIPFLF